MRRPRCPCGPDLSYAGQDSRLEDQDRNALAYRRSKMQDTFSCLDALVARKSGGLLACESGFRKVSRRPRKIDDFGTGVDLPTRFEAWHWRGTSARALTAREPRSTIATYYPAAL